MNVLNATDLNAAKTVASSLLSPAKQQPATVQANAAASTSGSTPSAASSSGSTITSNDFLTLLVTEMKNQDPTQPTDPNAYIQQLVGVNSLQQLIAINQDLTGTTGSGGTQTAAATPVTGSIGAV